jgi:hypothetical protein
VNGLRALAWSSLPISGYSIFDFDNTIIYYAGGESETLAQIMAAGTGNDPGSYLGLQLSFEFRDGNIQSLSWYSSRQIINVDLVFNAIPEPETWAMLLAGLGVVGMVARRKRRARVVV